MNRSLEALAIFVICLGGTLAVVRYSSSGPAAAGRNVADRQVPAMPAPSSSSAADKRPEAGEALAALESPVPAPPAEQPDYAHGCGLDRAAGCVYSPQGPLLSPRQIALQAIRSEPIPLVVLPDPASDEELATGYDPAYDDAMDPVASEDELSREQIEAEYSAAELSAAVAGSNLRAGAVLHSLHQQLLHLKSAYADPAARAVESKWSVSRWPLLLQYPRARREAQQQLHRQRADANRQQVSWDDYLSFAERYLNQPEETVQTAQERKAPKSKLFPR